MDVDDSVVELGGGNQLVQNLGPDDLYIAPSPDVDDTGFVLEAGSAVSLSFSNSGFYCVSAGDSEVRVLIGGTGLFTGLATAE